MKALITGAAGQVGKALVASAPEGWDVVALDRTGCDLASNESIQRAIDAHKPDLLFNAAAYTAVDRAEDEEALAVAINGTAPSILCDALANTGARLVHISSDFVFDGEGSKSWRPDATPRPLSAYGRSKAAGEIAAGPDALIVRTSWVYAAGGSNFVRTILRLVRERVELRIVADQFSAPTWAKGLADTLWALALRDVRGIWHHCDSGIASWYDFAVAIQEEAVALGLLDREIAIVPISTGDYPLPARRPAFSLLDASATRTLLADGHTHWRINLRRMLDEEKKIGRL
jgi:dTDP-4-dehydrorhamnose reductase